MRITESQLRRIIRQELLAAVRRDSENLDEGLKEKVATAVLAATIGFGALFGCSKTPSEKTQEKVVSITQQAEDQLGYTDQDLDKILAGLDKDSHTYKQISDIKNLGQYASDIQGTDSEKRAKLLNLYVADSIKKGNSGLKQRLDKIIKGK